MTKNVLKHDIPNPPQLLFRRNFPRVGTCCPILNIDNWSLKLDHVLNNHHKISGTYVNNDRSRLRFGGGTPQLAGVPIPGPAATGDKTQSTPGFIVRIAEDWTLGANKVNHFAFGYNQFRNANLSNANIAGTDWAAELGLKNVGSHAFPVIRWGGLVTPIQTGGYPTLGHDPGDNAPNGSGIVQNDFTWIRGSHSFRIGAEHRRYFLNDQALEGTGSYTFHNENTGLPGFTTSTGFAYASFMLGAVRNAGLGIPLLTPGIRSRTTAAYVQDDWKFSRNLTLNIGLRWDIPTALTETAQRMAGLDPAKPNPGADNFPGALAFLGDCNGCSGRGRFADPYYKQFAPRVGFAYSPGESAKMVIQL